MALNDSKTGKREIINRESEYERPTKEMRMSFSFDEFRKYFDNDQEMTPEEKFDEILKNEALYSSSKLYGRKKQVEKCVELFCRQAASSINGISKNQNFSCIIVNGISGSGKTRFSVGLFLEIKKYIMNAKKKQKVLNWCIPLNTSEKYIEQVRSSI